MKNILFVLAFVSILIGCTTDDASSNNNDNNTQANQQPTGSSSNDLLSDNTYTSMLIELVYVEGFEPTTAAVNNFVAFLEARTFKPNGIVVEKRAVASPGNSPYTNLEIRAIEDANRTAYNTSDEIAVWAFFADGESANNTNNGVVLGTAYRNTSFVIYEETIHDLSNSVFEPSRSLLETTVITHEFGHILGLTNLGADLQSSHEDAAHPKHCDEEDCLMYWSAETGDGIANLVSAGSAPQLDSQCIADLQANGGK